MRETERPEVYPHGADRHSFSTLGRAHLPPIPARGSASAGPQRPHIEARQRHTGEDHRQAERHRRPVLFPLLLSALIRLGRGWAGGRDSDNSTIAAFSVISTAATFTAIKLSPAFNALIAGFWGENSLDATDLWALLA